MAEGSRLHRYLVWIYVVGKRATLALLLNQHWGQYGEYWFVRRGLEDLAEFRARRPNEVSCPTDT